MKNKRNRELIWILVLLLLITGLINLTDKVQAAEKKETISIQISLPEKAKIEVSDLMVLTFLNKFFLTSNELKVSILVNSHQPIMVNNQDGELIMMGYVFGGELAQSAYKIKELKKYSTQFKFPIKINAASTALSLTMMNLAVGQIKPQTRLQFAKNVLNHDQFSALVTAVEKHLIETPDQPLINQNKVRQLTGNIVQDVYQELN